MIVVFDWALFTKIPAIVTVLNEKVPVAPAGEDAALRLTFPEKPPTLVTLIAVNPDLPDIIDKLF